MPEVHEFTHNKNPETFADLGVLWAVLDSNQ